MITKIAKGLLITASLSSTLMSCSKKEELQPTTSSTSTVADASGQIKLASGRLVFANNDAFQQALDKVSKMSETQAEQWSKELRFISLRQLSQPSAKDENAAQLNNSFGFPAANAALINGKGEYQIGNRISWYHDGFRYVASSEGELSSIKANPNAATEKFAAGVKTTTNTLSAKGGKSSITVDPISTTNRTIRNNTATNGDGKYGNYHFYLNRYGTQDNGSYRQLGFESVLYQEDVTDRVSPAISGQRTYYTSIYLNEYYEERGSSGFRRCDDYPRLTTINLSSGGTARGDNWHALVNGSWSPKGGTLYADSNINTGRVSHSGGDYQTTVLRGYLSAYLGPGTGSFIWDYSITGDYTTQVSIDSYHIHTESGNLW